MVSVIIPIYNLAGYLDKCIQSVLNQTYTDLDIVLVDDGSTDDSWLICKKYQRMDKRIQCVQLQNGGVSRARNKGLEMAKGELVTFVDGDDFIADNHISILQNNLLENNVDISIGNLFVVKDEKTKELEWEATCGKIERNQICRDIIKEKSYRGYVFNKLFRTELIQQNNIQFDETVKICEDLLFVIEYIMVISNFAYVTKEATYYYVQHKDSALNSKYRKQNVTALIAWEKICRIITMNVPNIADKYRKLYLLNAMRNKEGLVQIKGYYGPEKKMVEDAINKYYTSVMYNCSFREQIYFLIRKNCPWITVLLKEIYHKWNV